MHFVSSFRAPERIPENAFCFLFRAQRLLIKEEGKKLFFPQWRDVRALGLNPVDWQYLGTLSNRSCYTAMLKGMAPSSNTYSFRGVRSLFGQVEEDQVWIAGLANQFMTWSENHRFCGKCGKPTENKADERAKLCPSCGLVNYPRLSPAVIVAVIKDHKILLAQSQRFHAKFYSVLAGFTEPGETLEGCVKREIHEEVNIIVKNIRYFGSQPWPFPDSLMIGFTAEYAEGEIEIDEAEIVDAGWYSPEELPQIPPKISIARQLIDWFIEKHGRPEPAK
jgi:NAD+ diphosphatase